MDLERLKMNEKPGKDFIEKNLKELKNWDMAQEIKKER